MKPNGVAALQYMKDLSKKQAAGVRGMCLKTCQDAWDIPPRAPSAIAAWNMIAPKDRHPDYKKAPVGAPHFFTGATGGLRKYGHIVLQSEHVGFVWSTDVPHADQVGLVPITYFEKVWGAKYLGWSHELEGVHLPLNIPVKWG